MNEAILNFIEKRIFRRLDTDVSVELELKNRTVKTTALNISCGGMFLKLDPKQVSEEDQVQVVVHLPNRDKPVKLSGEITRSETGSRRGVGVQFQGLYNDNILAIERYVKSKLN